MSVSVRPRILGFPRMHSACCSLCAGVFSSETPLFSGPLTQNAECTLTVTNNNARPVAFQIMTTNSKVRHQGALCG